MKVTIGYKVKKESIVCTTCDKPYFIDCKCKDSGRKIVLDNDSQVIFMGKEAYDLIRSRNLGTWSD